MCCEWVRLVWGWGMRSTASGQDVATEKWVLPIAVVAVGMFMSLLDVTIVNVAVPAIQKDFGGSLEDVLWIATAYTLTLGVVVPLTSWLGDKFGLTKLYIAAVLGFAAGSWLCGLAWNLHVLIMARILQAVPGGILPVVCVAIVYRIVPKDKISAAMGIVGLAFVAAPAAGPVVGGYLVQYVDWRLVFYMNIPVGLLTAIASLSMLPRVPPRPTGRFDLAGFVAIAVSVSAILLAASKGESWGWGSYPILILVTVGVLSLALFVVIEMQVAEPLLELRLFRNLHFTLGVTLIAILSVNLLASSFYLPVFLQQGQHMEAFDAGLRVFPQALGMCVASMLTGQLYDRLGPRVLCVYGCAVAHCGNLLLLWITPEMTYSQIVIWTSIRGFGMSVAAVAGITAAVNSVRPTQTDHASAIENLLQQVIGAFGLAMLGTLLTSQVAQLTADRTALLTPDSQLARSAAPALTDAGGFSAETFAAVYRAGSRLTVDVTANALSNVFLALVATTLLGVALALLLPDKLAPVTEEDGVPEDAGHDARRSTTERTSQHGHVPTRGKHRAGRIPEAQPVPRTEQLSEPALRL